MRVAQLILPQKPFDGEKKKWKWWQSQANESTTATQKHSNTKSKTASHRVKKKRITVPNSVYASEESYLFTVTAKIGNSDVLKARRKKKKTLTRQSIKDTKNWMKNKDWKLTIYNCSIFGFVLNTPHTNEWRQTNLRPTWKKKHTTNKWLIMNWSCGWSQYMKRNRRNHMISCISYHSLVHQTIKEMTNTIQKRTKTAKQCESKWATTKTDGPKWKSNITIT